MASADALSPYLERLLDDYVVENGAEALDRLAAAGRRVHRKPSRALDDRKLQRQLRDGTAALRRTALALQGRPPKRRRPRRLLLLGAIVVAGATAALVAKPDVRGRLLGAISGTRTEPDPSRPNEATATTTQEE